KFGKGDGEPQVPQDARTQFQGGSFHRRRGRSGGGLDLRPREHQRCNETAPKNPGPHLCQRHRRIGKSDHRKHGRMVLEKIRASLSWPLRDRGARNTHCALHLSRSVNTNRSNAVASAEATTQSRSVSVCCRGLVAESRAVRLLFSCSRDIRPELAKLRSAPRHREFARPCGAAPSVRFVATLGATVFLRAVP